jgi:hypothetical protein
MRFFQNRSDVLGQLSGRSLEFGNGDARSDSCNRKKGPTWRKGLSASGGAPKWALSLRPTSAAGLG